MANTNNSSQSLISSQANITLSILFELFKRYQDLLIEECDILFTISIEEGIRYRRLILAIVEFSATVADLVDEKEDKHFFLERLNQINPEKPNNTHIYKLYDLLKRCINLITSQRYSRDELIRIKSYCFCGLSAILGDEEEIKNWIEKYHV